MHFELQGAKTEYKSITVAEDATAEEFMDFYLADPVRPTWVWPLSYNYLALCLNISAVFPLFSETLRTLFDSQPCLLISV